jgi:glycosyltransferase involved in cell wall biosynthesis
VTISVIIPTARDSAAVGALLESLRAQIVDAPYEVILVNDLPAMERSDPDFCTVLRGEGKGPACARNLGAAHAKGKFLLFLDDDVKIDESYIARILREIDARPGQAVSGMQRAIERNNSFSLAAEWMLHLFVDESCHRFAPSNALAMRRADFERCGGFDPFFPLAGGEDREFSIRWIACGFKIACVESACVEHRFPRTFGSLAKQQWRYGRGAFQLRHRVPERGLGVRYYYRMLTEAPLRYGFLMGLRVSMLCFVSQAILASGYLRERIRPAAQPLATPEEACAE